MPQALVNSFGAGIGFLLAMVIFSGMRSKLEGNDAIPAAVPGSTYHNDYSRYRCPLAFMGFGGLSISKEAIKNECKF